MENFISPIEYRYNRQTSISRKYFSHYNVLYRKFLLEVRYFQHIRATHGGGFLESLQKICCVNLFDDFDDEDFAVSVCGEIEQIEKNITNHDIKAIEYIVRRMFEHDEHKHLVHFGLTSDDIVSVISTLSIYKAYEEIYSTVYSIIDGITETKNIGSYFMGRTHGQAAIPTTFHDQLVHSYINRIKDYKLDRLVKVKFGGAINNGYTYGLLNVQHMNTVHDDFIYRLDDKLDIHRLCSHTQTDQNAYNYKVYSNLNYLCNVLINFCQDVWEYYSRGLLYKTDSYIGSSTMPNKSNPIEFENAEGNLKIARSMLSTYMNDMTISRLQRDLSGSTIIRNVGVVFAHVEIAVNSMRKGLRSMSVNVDAATLDITNNEQFAGEYIQLFKKLHHKSDAYKEISDLYKGGMSSRDIAELLGVDYTPIERSISNMVATNKKLVSTPQ